LPRRLDKPGNRIIFHSPCSLRASSRDVSEMEQGAAPAGGDERTPAPGRPRVAVRPHYEGLPLMAGRGADEGGRKPAGSGEPKAARVCVRKNGPEDLKSRCGAPRGARILQKRMRQLKTWCAAWRSTPSAWRRGKQETASPRRKE